MTGCEYCDSEFSKRKDRLKHELDEHGDEMSGHEKDDKNRQLNKLEQQQQTSKHMRNKQLQYGTIGLLLVGLVAGGAFYASQNMSSVGGQTNATTGVGQPVHWHADYQITVCGESQVLRGGPIEAHTHGETTFHLEGVRQTREQATLDWIVDSLGGELERDSIMGREDCNGEPANLTVTVNGNEVDDHLDYVVKDGDRVRIDYS
jgi:hypothetical protein